MQILVRSVTLEPGIFYHIWSSCKTQRKCFIQKKKLVQVFFTFLSIDYFHFDFFVLCIFTDFSQMCFWFQVLLRRCHICQYKKNIQHLEIFFPCQSFGNNWLKSQFIRQAVNTHAEREREDWACVSACVSACVWARPKLRKPTWSKWEMEKHRQKLLEKKCTPCLHIQATHARTHLTYTLYLFFITHK